MESKVWITKFALTQGILVRTAEIKQNDTLISVKDESGHSSYFFEPYWHLTEEAAKEHARELKEKKIKGLKKQIEKLEKLEF